MKDKDLQNISNLLDEKLANSEKKLTNALDKRLKASEEKISGLMDEKLAISEKKILNEIGDFIHQNLLPQLNEKADRNDLEKISGQMDRIERKLDNFSGQVTSNNQRLNDLESLPIIAHELRKKK